ncbi:alkane hydroxylase MAH1-like [Impatiens glandulifera]|uniref:alkane hydroxylase MAH1-like n=1 Tax=Impatiens glandulifera TaxID=253017 RepID=UPI001FB0FAEC|nr:alkane hydroxylase MAH1-like [Impatiens glandulifera]
MAIVLGYFEMATTLLFLVVVADFFHKNRGFRLGTPIYWPIIGMLPSIIEAIYNTHNVFFRVHSKVGCTFYFRGPWFTKMNIIISVDPADIHYILSTNMNNYPKAPLFSKMFDFMGNAWFNCDGDEWKAQRRVAQALLTNHRFYGFLGRISMDKVKNGLIPILDNAANRGTVLDLQDLFNRLIFDTSCKIVTGYDPRSLSLELPEVPFSNAIDEAEESVLVRHGLPDSLWKLARWLGIGSEKTLKHAWKVLDVEIAKYISMKREQMAKETNDDKKINGEEEEECEDFLSSYLNAKGSMYTALKIDDSFLRDSILNYMLASRDTSSSSLIWFIWLASTHPEILLKIREELKSALPPSEADKPHIFKAEEVNKLTYLSASVNESLRLYPPVPLQLRQPAKPDVLPSGIRANPKDKIIVSFYAMARMKFIWGEDCSEFKPERWITEKGTIKHEPSYKYPVFNDGPRNCLGKEMALTQTKMVAATILHNYNVDVAKGHVVETNCSIILYMKHGLKVNVAKRWT